MAVTDFGALGTSAKTEPLTAADAAEVPTPLMALTVTEYVAPLVNPVMVHVVSVLLSPVQPAPADGEMVTW